MRNCKGPIGAIILSGVISAFSMENRKLSQVDLMLIPIGEVVVHSSSVLGPLSIRETFNTPFAYSRVNPVNPSRVTKAVSYRLSRSKSHYSCAQQQSYSYWLSRSRQHVCLYLSFQAVSAASFSLALCLLLFVLFLCCLPSSLSLVHGVCTTFHASVQVNRNLV